MISAIMSPDGRTWLVDRWMNDDGKDVAPSKATMLAGPTHDGQRWNCLAADAKEVSMGGPVT